MKSFLYPLFRKFLKFEDYLRYKSSEKREDLTITLTFDDKIDGNTIGIPEFLSKRGIAATFFMPPGKTEPQYIERIVSLGHELGGHGWNHGKEEVENHHGKSSKRCFDYLKKFFPKLASWRFPGLRTSKMAYKNVRNAGFKIDSTKGSYFPIQNPVEYMGLREYPFIRLPPEGQMDLNVDRYSQIKNFVFAMADEFKGIAVLGFHIFFQQKHFAEFKELISGLERKDLKFKRLIDVDRNIHSE